MEAGILVKVLIQAKLLQAYLAVAQTLHIIGVIAVGPTQINIEKPHFTGNDMKTRNHDTLVYRLAQILIKLNQGEKIDPVSLADEFGVNMRTVQRDLNVRFAYLPLRKTDGRYHLDSLPRQTQHS